MQLGQVLINHASWLGWCAEASWDADSPGCPCLKTAWTKCWPRADRGPASHDLLLTVAAVGSQQDTGPSRCSIKWRGPLCRQGHTCCCW